MTFTLDKDQLEVVNSAANNIIVAAGAGSGKTRVLTERVKRLLQEGVNPRSMVIITFTNMAADELHERLKDVKGSDKCFIGTIHSFAKKVLTKSGYNFDIYSEYYQTEYMKYLIQKYAKYATFSDYLNLLAGSKEVSKGKMSENTLIYKFDNNVIDELYILLGNQPPHNKLNPRNYPLNVLQLCRVNNIITFNQLIKESTNYFEKSNTKIQYLFVDELQDIGYSEYNFLLELKSDNNFFIGDDYQSIYGFKGGDVGIFLSLLRNPEWKSFVLKNNYRNGSNILNVANSIISRADDILNKSSVCCSGRTGKVTVKSKVGLEYFLKTFESTNSSYGDWFFLTRTNKDIDKLSAMLKEYQIPFTCFKKSDLSKSQLDSAMKSDTVKLLTIHTSKGLESKNVLIYGNFPMTFKSNVKSEELKVFYVGMTRAQENLFIFN